MRLLNSAFSIFCLLIFCTELSAQTPVVTKVPSATPKAKVINNDLMLFELEMAENGYSINKSLESKSRLLSIYEKIIFARCLSEAQRSLTASAASKDETCIELVDKLFTLDKGNVLAFCTRDGIDSRTCKAASEEQTLQTFDPERDTATGKASLEEVVAAKKDGPKIREQTGKLQSKLNILKYDKKKTNHLPEQRQLFEQILSLNCKGSRVSLSSLASGDLQAEPTKASSLVPPDEDGADLPPSAKPTSAKPDPFSEMLKEHFKTPTPKVELPKSYRVYEVTTDCDKYIKQAFEIDPNSPAGNCHKWGQYSWHCFQARRLNQQANPVSRSETFTQPTGNIQIF